MEDKVTKVKLKTLQVEEQRIKYTHKVIPNHVTINLTFKDIFKLLIKKTLYLNLNIYMNQNKIVYIVGLI